MEIGELELNPIGIPIIFFIINKSLDKLEVNQLLNINK